MKQVLLAVSVLMLGCGSAECLIPCSSGLFIEATVPTPGPGPLSADFCDGPRCGSASIASGGECASTTDPTREFFVCLEGATMTITRGDILTSPDGGSSTLVTLTVRSSEGTVLLMEEGYPTVRYEVQCGNFPCPQRTITF